MVNKLLMSFSHLQLHKVHRSRASRRGRKSGPQRQPAPVATLRFSGPSRDWIKVERPHSGRCVKTARPDVVTEDHQSAPGAAAFQ
jgi:hypothetical protein